MRVAVIVFLGFAAVACADAGSNVTFVPEPWDYAAALPEDFALPFEGLTLEVPAEP